MAYETLRTRARGDVLEVTLDRPDRLNAINAAMLEELRRALTDEARAARAVLLLGNERAFSSGQDIADPALGSPENAADVLDRLYNPLIRMMSLHPCPIVAAVRGAAAGAGASLALAADIVVASETARFDMAFARIGLIPDCGATHALPRLVGPARARGMMMLAEPVDGATAAAWGLVWTAVPDESVEPEARAIADRLAAGPTRAYGFIKDALVASATASLADQLARERDLQVAAAATEDCAEGIAAFRAKRAPVFRGR